jgi:dTDP-4-amino-4,6-dideoxygalactose transaminase
MIPITRPDIGEKEARAARKVILSGWVTQGPKVKEFEEAFASYVGAKYACAVSSCTTALHLSLLAAGVEPGDAVITVSHSFIATANSVRHCGAEPVFIDIDLRTYNMSPALLEEFLAYACERRGGALYYKKPSGLTSGESPLRCYKGRRTAGRIGAIIPVHQMGMPCDIASIVAIARRYRIPVVEDAACAIGSEVSREKVGKPHGDIACFSFHPRKVITTGDGGMITTNNISYDRKVWLLRHHGMGTSDVARHSAKKVTFEKYLTTGYNFRMTDIQAAVGIEQLRKVPRIVRERRSAAALYGEYLNGISWITAPGEPAYCRSNWQSYAVRVLDGSPLSRNGLMQKLLDAGVATRRGIMNAHQERPYNNGRWNLKNSELARDSAILLPIFPGLKVPDIKKISRLIRYA